MATTPDTERQEAAFFQKVGDTAKATFSHPRFRDTVIPSTGIGAVTLAATGNVAAAFGTSLLAFALLDKRR